MAIKPRTVQGGKIMLLAENGGQANKIDLPRKEVWAVVPSELCLAEGAAVDITGWNYVKWDKSRVWVVARWRPEDKEPVQFLCERFNREFFIQRLIAEEYFPIGNHLYDARKLLRVREKDIIARVDSMYRWREDDDLVWCSPNVRDTGYKPIVKPYLSLRKRLKLAGKDKDEV